MFDMEKPSHSAKHFVSCAGMTKKGTRCKNPPIHGLKYCHLHQPKAGAGASPKKPSPKAGAGASPKKKGAKPKHKSFGGAVPITRVHYNYDRYLDISFWSDGVEIHGHLLISDGGGDDGSDELYQLKHWKPEKGTLVVSEDCEDDFDDDDLPGYALKFTSRGLQILHEDEVVHTGNASERDMIQKRILQVFKENDVEATSPRGDGEEDD